MLHLAGKACHWYADRSSPRTCRQRRHSVIEVRRRLAVASHVPTSLRRRTTTSEDSEDGLESSGMEASQVRDSGEQSYV